MLTNIFYRPSTALNRGLFRLGVDCTGDELETHKESEAGRASTFITMGSAEWDYVNDHYEFFSDVNRYTYGLYENIYEIGC